MIKINQLDEDQVKTIQQQKLRKLIQFAAKYSEFYGELYKGINLETCEIEDLPIVTKKKMMENFNRIVTDKRITLQEMRTWLEREGDSKKLYFGKFLPIVTSGSTGEKAVVVYDKTALSTVQAAFFSRYPYQKTPSPFERWKILLHYLLGAKARLAVIVATGGSIYIASTYAPKFHSLFVNKAEFSILDPIEKMVKDLNAFKPDQLITYPSLIDILAQEQLEGRLNIAFNRPMSFLVGCAEPLYERTRKLAKKAWNVDILDTYGATECFVIARSCSRFERMHIMSDLCVLEIVDRDYKPVQHGQRGEKVLLTNLFNFVQPFIRYELTDIAGISAQSCGCDLPFPTLTAVEGRTDDILYLEKQGGGYTSVHPFPLIAALGHVSGLRQFQIVQTKRNEIMCRYVPENDSVRPEINIRNALKKVFMKSAVDTKVDIKLEQMNSISRHDMSKKYKSILNRIGPPQELRRRRAESIQSNV
jgi:phenylacetate-coenzyme A ligase PaaK-like adenylate-forming protein